MRGRKGTLEIDEDIVFQRREWLAQRVGKFFLFVIVVCALIGITGMGGPLSRGEAGEPAGGVHVEYERVVRRSATATMTLHFRGGPGEVKFWVAAPYVSNVVVQTVVPTPSAVSVEHERYVYTVQAGTPDISVILQMKHMTVGRIEAELGLVEGPSVRFTQVSLF